MLGTGVVVGSGTTVSTLVTANDVGLVQDDNKVATINKHQTQTEPNRLNIRFSI
jgi:hypothetical protein